MARYRFELSLAVILAALLIGWDAEAQMPPSSSTTSTPVPGAGHDYLGEIAETVNPVNGSISIRVNALMPPGRGLTLPFSFAYDSNGVNYVSQAGGSLSWMNPPTTLTSQGGWSNSAPSVSFSEITWTAISEEGHHQACHGFVNYVYQDAAGNRHNLNLTNFWDPSGVCASDDADWPRGFGGDVVTQGGEGPILASIPTSGLSGYPVTVADADGTVLQFSIIVAEQPNGGLVGIAGSVEDGNGNLVAVSGPTGTANAYNYTDTAGRTVLQDSGFAISPETVTVPGLNLPYTLQWTTLSTPTFTAPVTVISGTACNFGGVHQPWVVGQQGTAEHGLSSLTLPNGKSFSFTYDSTYKVISKITYPTGGYIRYVWGMNPQAEFGSNSSTQSNDQCSALYGLPVITDRYVSFTGSTEVQHQHFAYSTVWTGGAWTSKQTTVTTADLVRNTSYNTIYTYTPRAAEVPPNTLSGPTTDDPVEASIAYYDTTGTLLKTVAKTWKNVRLLATQTTTYPNSVATKTAWSYNNREQQTEKDDYDFSTSTPPLLRKTVTNYQQFNLNFYPSAQTIADRPCQVITYDSTGTNRVAETDYFYDNGATTTPCGAAGTPSLTGAGGSSLTGHDETNYSATSTRPRGNLTTVTKQCFLGSTACTVGNSTTAYTYDETGQILSATDPNGNQTSYSYTDAFLNTNASGFTATAGSPPTGEVTNAYLTQITHPATNGVNHIESFFYGYNDGEPTQAEDENSQITPYKYNDSLGRLTESDYPDGGQTFLKYDDSALSITTCQLINGTAGATCSATSPAAGWKTSLASMDGLGHVVQTELASDPDGTTYVATTYDGNARKYQVSNPYRSTSDSTYGVTTYVYDALGRPCLTVQPDVASVPTTCPASAPAGNVFTSYSANQIAVTDETGSQRTNQDDGLGRLTNVWEAPNNSSYNYKTTYAYDALGNLLSASQAGGSRTRTFTYDSLSQLLCAANPEVQSVTCPAPGGSFPTGAITYSYDANGNVLTKVAPKPGQTGTATVTTTYSYDALNRLTEKSYTGLTTPTSQYGYDGTSLTGCTVALPALISPTNLVGRRSAACGGLSSSKWSYDSMGRTLAEARANKGSSAKTLEIDDAYNLDGSLSLLAYPSGNIMHYTVGGAGRTTEAVDTQARITGLNYAPNGSLAGADEGAVLIANIYNDRLQPILLSALVNSSPVLSLCYDFHSGVAISSPPCFFSAYSTGNNGNVFQIIDNFDSTRGAAFLYDPLNRISQANTINKTSSNCWGEAYTVDAWGNMTNRATVSGMSGSCSTEGLSATATSQNRLSGIGLQYDAAGNVTTDNLGNALTYDAENRIATYASYTYSYDADGMRIEKASGSSGTMYWTGPDGKVLAESNLAGTVNEEYIYVNGERVARVDQPGGIVHYYLSDKLGSASVITDPTGVVQEQYYYYPYGGMQSSSGSDTNRYKFTGKERDSESGLDMFGARYYGSSLGRFMQPDWAAAPTAVPYAHYGNPQSLNLYAYVENNPTTTGDPDGHGDAGTFCSAECRARYAQYAAEHPVAATLEPIAEFGTIPTAMVGGAAAWGSALFRNLLGLGLATAPTTVPLINEAIEGLTPGQNATLGRAGALGVSSIEKLGESGFVGSLENGARISAGFEKVGDALGVNISNIQSAARGSVNFNALESGAVNLAKSEGASSLTITATNVTNSKLAQTLEKAGYAAQQVSDNFGRTTVNYVKKICTASGGCQ